VALLIFAVLMLPPHARAAIASMTITNMMENLLFRIVHTP